MLGFLVVCTVEGVGTVEELSYVRSLPAGEHRGLVHVVPDLHANVLYVTLNTGLRSVAFECLVKITCLFDPSCCPQQIIAALGSLGAARPGLRLPGSADASKQGVRAISGQPVSVLMAAKLTTRVAHVYGEALEDVPEYVCFPTPEAFVNVDSLHLKALGMPLKRAGASIRLAHATLEETLVTTIPVDIEQGVKQLQTFPGIGHWTVNYSALRGWQAKDVFLPDDHLIKQCFLGMTPVQIRRYAERWEPWRSYALLHIWYTDDWQPSIDGEITDIQQQIQRLSVSNDIAVNHINPDTRKRIHDQRQLHRAGDGFNVQTLSMALDNGHPHLINQVTVDADVQLVVEQQVINHVMLQVVKKI